MSQPVKKTIIEINQGLGKIKFDTCPGTKVTDQIKLVQINLHLFQKMVLLIYQKYLDTKSAHQIFK